MLGRQKQRVSSNFVPSDCAIALSAAKHHDQALSRRETKLQRDAQSAAGSWSRDWSAVDVPLTRCSTEWPLDRTKSEDGATDAFRFERWRLPRGCIAAKSRCLPESGALSILAASASPETKVSLNKPNNISKRKELRLELVDEDRAGNPHPSLTLLIELGLTHPASLVHPSFSPFVHSPYNARYTLQTLQRLPRRPEDGASIAPTSRQ